MLQRWASLQLAPASVSHAPSAAAADITGADRPAGGVVYPIMLQRLFITCGFGWGVRISGFICLVVCALACCAVTSHLERERTSNPWFDLSHFRDDKFVLLIVGSVLISLGERRRRSDASCAADIA